MNNNRPNWIAKPTKRQMILIALLWFSGIFLTLVSITNVFTENPFVTKNILLLLIQIAATFTFLIVLKNYYQQLKRN